MHYYKRNIGDYHKKAGRLSMLEHGAYTLLIDACYDRERFPTEADAIDWCWARSDEEITAVRFVLGKFFELDGAVYVQTRISEEIEAYKGMAIKNKEIAENREKAKREGRNGTSTKRAPVVNESPPNQEPLTTNQKPRTLKEPKGDQQADAEQKSPRRNWVKELVGLGVEEKFAKDWMAVRKAKKASMTDTALEAIQREAGVAGITFGEAVRIAAENSWQGFKAAWVNKPGANGAGQFMTKQERIEAANQQVLLEMNAAEDARIAAMGEQLIRLDDQGFIIEGDFFHAT